MSRWNIEKTQSTIPAMSLFDQLHGWTYSPGGDQFFQGHAKREWQAAKVNFRIALRQARRFVLDDDFVRAAVRRGTVSPAKMLNLCHLANLPFDKCWFEYDSNVRVDMQAEQGTGDPREDELGVAGFLMERLDPANPSAYCITHSGMILEELLESRTLALDINCGVAPTSFLVDTSGMLPWLMADHVHVDDTVRSVEDIEVSMRGLAWGYFKNNVAQGILDYTCGEELQRRGGISLEKRFFRKICNEAVFRDRKLGKDVNGKHIMGHFCDDVIESRGNLRFYTAVLAMINSVPTQYVHRPAKGYHRARLRNVPYLDSHTVTIHCDRVHTQTIVDRYIREALGRHNKRHEVRGHWALAKYGVGGRACRHEPVERDGAYAMCGRCERLIVWRDHYERGDAALGFVRHDYEVQR